MIVILINDLSISYFTYSDEYWTVYYVKPYSRLPVYLIGVFCATAYYSLKHEDLEKSSVAKALSIVRFNHVNAILASLIGVLLSLITLLIMQMLNNSPNNSPLAINMLYLLLSRPMFSVGFSLFILPVLISAKTFKTLRNFLSHSFWVPFSRLTYGAFLSNGMFMQFREFNSERGEWGCAFDAILLFLAYVVFSYLFSFLIYLMFEMPVYSLYMEFYYQEPNLIEAQREKIADVFYGKDSVDNKSMKGYAKETEKILSKKKLRKK